MNFNWDITPTFIIQLVVQVVLVTILIVRVNDATKRHESKIEKLEKNLIDFKLEVARDYASKNTMAEALRPLLDELHALRDRIDKLIDRRGT